MPQQKSKSHKSNLSHRSSGGVRFDPAKFFVQEIDKSIDILHNLLSTNIAANLSTTDAAQLYQVPIDVIERENDFLVKAELPGF